MERSELVDAVKSCADDVDGVLGEFHSEYTYHQAMITCLSEKGIPLTREATIPVMYRSQPIARLHPDMVIGDDQQLVIELKKNRDGTEQCRNYLSSARKAGMDEIIGGVAISFGETLTITEI